MPLLRPGRVPDHRPLERWREYVDRHEADLAEIGAKAGRVVDQKSSLAEARWGYGNAVSSGAQAWVKSGVYEMIGTEYVTCLA
jgi:hypothetical protein